MINASQAQILRRAGWLYMLSARRAHSAGMHGLQITDNWFCLLSVGISPGRISGFISNSQYCAAYEAA
jgi:hypothetical protein